MSVKFLNKNLISGSIPLALVIYFQNCAPAAIGNAAISQPQQTAGTTHFQDPSSTQVTKETKFSRKKMKLKESALEVSGISAERSKPNVYLLSLHKARGLVISLPKKVILENTQLTLTKLRGNCPKTTPKIQTLQVEWKEKGATHSSGVIPYLQNREIWNEQLQGCDFELKVQGETSGEIHEYKAILDARVCSDGEHTQLSQFTADCQTQGPSRNYFP